MQSLAHEPRLEWCQAQSPGPRRCTLDASSLPLSVYVQLSLESHGTEAATPSDPGMLKGLCPFAQSTD